MGSLYWRGHTIQEVGGEMVMGSCIFGVESLYSRFYGKAHNCYILSTYEKLCKCDHAGSFPDFLGGALGQGYSGRH